MTSVRVQARDHLKDALGALAKVAKNDDGRISWDAHQLDEGTFEVIYSLSFSPPIADHVKDGAIWQVLNECARANDFSTKFFTRRLLAFLNDLGNRDPRPISAIGQINASFSANMPTRLATPDGTIRIATSLPKIYGSVIGKLEDYERERLGFQNDFVYFSCDVSTRDDRAAIDLAERKIKYALGVLNLANHGYGLGRRFGYPNAPLGRFLSASTVCTINRKTLKFGGYLSESHFPIFWKRNFTVWQNQESDRIGRITKNYVRDLKKIDFLDRVIQAILLFQEGLETTHIDLALMRFWTGIELLCAREDREATDRIVERASSIFTDVRHATMRLNFIQDFRNRVVHRGNVGSHALLSAQWGSIFLARLIEFCVFNRFKFRTRKELLDYLSTPTNEHQLVDVISAHRKRLRTLQRRAKAKAS